jgi:hypothetical protein
MTTSVVVGGIFLAVDDLLRMVQVLVRSGADLVAHTRFQIYVDGPRHMLARRRFRKESVERIVRNAMGQITAHDSGRVNAVLQAIKLPALVSGLQNGTKKKGTSELTIKYQHFLQLNVPEYRLDRDGWRYILMAARNSGEEIAMVFAAG